MWKVEGFASKGAYNYAIVPTHPSATTNGYVLAHRIVAENHLGRLLLKDEVVHHVNENKKDNKPSNLRVMLKSGHARRHQIERGGSVGLFQCQNCKTVFKSHASKYVTKASYYLSCSSACSVELRSKVSRGVTSRKALRKNNLIKVIDDNLDIEIKLPKKMAPGNWQAKYAVESKLVPRKFKPKLKIKCAWCSKVVIDARSRKYCSPKCNLAMKRSVSTKPTKTVLRSALKTCNYSELGRHYAVSSNAVKKWAQGYGLVP